MFEKILIANRGEIACRVAATARRLGIRTVAVYSEADARAKHVAACDEAVCVGTAAPQDSYLRWERIIEAARASGAQAIHPGYGFLSENEAFARACTDAGLVFIGPPPAAIAAMGLKAESKRLMQAAGVPLVPGYHGTEQDPALLAQEADRIGYPVLIKASAGGGGKGMRRVEHAADFAAALASCQREAQSSFGNPAVLIEKYVLRPRHIEIQVFADTHGNAVYLFERDCSVQRRHQKVLEEAPAPGLPEDVRARMGTAAVAAARAVGYVGAGTVEFIVEQPQGYGLGGSEPAQQGSVGARFFFMEMNTRLQVEHPVTEAITGLDLVEWQLRVAAGAPLPLTQAQLRRSGHAIEARICAENPDKQFLPATGTLQVYRKPAHRSFAPATVRIDDGVRAGDGISPHYDSMIAKLIVHGETRAQALARLDQALAQLHIVGVSNNVQFLRHVLRSDSFAQARLDTALIEREASVLFEQQPLSLPLTVAAAVTHTLLHERACTDADPFSQRDGWRSHGVCQRPFVFEDGTARIRATLSYGRDGSLHLSVAAGDAGAEQGAGAGAESTHAAHATDCSGALRFAPISAAATAADAGAAAWAADPANAAPALPLDAASATDAWAFELSFAGTSTRASVYAQGERVHVFTPCGARALLQVDLLAHAGDAAATGGRLSAPMPGKIIAFLVQPGAAVLQGQPLAVLEAMKMEHTIAAPSDGSVTELLYAVGDQVAEGAELLKLSAPAPQP